MMFANAKPIMELVDPASYAGYGEVTNQVPAIADVGSGGALVVDRAKTPAVDGVRAHTPEPTPETYVAITGGVGIGTYVFSGVIDLADYNGLTIFPEQTSAPAGAVTITYKLQWSIDQTNWADHTIATYAAAAGGERIATEDVKTHTWDGNVSAAFKLLAAFPNEPKQARYYRIGQKPSTAVAVNTKYHLTLL